MRTATLAFLALGLAACGDKDTDTADGNYDPTTFPGGSFQFTSYAVDDACLDGAMAVLFLPEGDGTTNDWAYPVDLPAWSDLPATYDVQLQDPFSTMSVTVEAGDSVGTMIVNGAEQTGVEWDADNYPGCTVDMDIDVTVVINSDTDVSGTATMSTGNWTGDSCPVVTSDPCTIVLDFTGTAL